MVDETLWKCYITTCFKITIWPRSDSFAIITAWNPGSKLTSQTLNWSFNERLQHRIKDYDWSSLLAGDPTFTWVEESFAVAIDLSTALCIAREFEQNAIFYVQNNELFLCSCDEQRVDSIGVFSDRVLKKS